MRQKHRPEKEPAETVVKEIRRATRKHYSAEEKIRIVLEGLRGEDSIAELCRREGISPNGYYRWSKEFLEAGKKRLAGDTAREATSDEVRGLRREAVALKEVVADLTLENRLVKKTRTAKLTGRPAVREPPGKRRDRVETGCAEFARGGLSPDAGASFSSALGSRRPSRELSEPARASR
ncbi:Transposase [Microvirga lotononidis]|uniref:Transposase n=1 Tax=Microvirga lotononidis TaxID=864069 RepID=I4YQD6_9HYPH|nr:Transposase [Microvirga lotononidis]